MRKALSNRGYLLLAGSAMPLAFALWAGAWLAVIVWQLVFVLTAQSSRRQAGGALPRLALAYFCVGRLLGLYQH